MNNRAKEIRSDLDILRSVFGDSMPTGTYVLLAKKYGVSRERVRQLGSQGGSEITRANAQEKRCRICEAPFFYSKGDSKVNCDNHRNQQKNYSVLNKELLLPFSNRDCFSFAEFFISNGLTISQCHRMLRYAIRDGMVERIERGLYRIVERG